MRRCLCARTTLASSPGLQLCGGKAWYRLHAHARVFCKICRIRIRTDIVGLYVYGQFYGKVYGNLAHEHAVDTGPSLRIIEGLGTRLAQHVQLLKRHRRPYGRYVNGRPVSRENRDPLKWAPRVPIFPVKWAPGSLFYQENGDPGSPLSQ